MKVTIKYKNFIRGGMKEIREEVTNIEETDNGLFIEYGDERSLFVPLSYIERIYMSVKK